jgi:Fur family iron response transcriptional regulator
MAERPKKQGMTGEIEKLLMQHKISPTRQRRQIARIMFARPQHLSAEQILEAVNQEGGGNNVVSKATVYNTLGLFVNKGLIREVIVNSNKVFYDSNTKAHHHFYNVDTGMLQDVDVEHLALSAMPIPPQGTEFDGVDIIMRVRSKP